MQIREVIEQAQQGQAMANLARTFGIGEDEARAVADAVLPDLAFALERNTLSRGGLADFVRALGDGHHEAILEAPQAWTDPRVVADGQAILRHVMGSPYKVQALSDRAARASGLGGSLIEALLPILAQMLMGAISRYMKGGLGDVLSKLPIPGGGPSHDTGGTMPERRIPGGFDLPRTEIPPAGGYPMPPMPDDGSGRAGQPEQRTERHEEGGYRLPWPGGSPDDVWGRSSRPREEHRLPEPVSGERDGGIGLPRQAPEPTGAPPPGGYQLPRYEMPTSPDRGREDEAGSQGGGFPFPFPMPGQGRQGGQDQGRNPYEDLSDILKRSGSSVPSGSSGMLWNIIRNLLGGALGFGGGGFMSWLIRLIVMKWGWGLLRRVLFGR
jgi:hypothetical protein